MNIVIDTNILFNAMLKPNNKIGLIIITGYKYFNFISPNLLNTEIVKHKNKILNLSGYSSYRFDELYSILTKKIAFIDEVLISRESTENASKLVSGIDENDLAFVALTIEAKGKLWTGDKVLSNGLVSKGFNEIIQTEELFDIFKENVSIIE